MTIIPAWVHSGKKKRRRRRTNSQIKTPYFQLLITNQQKKSNLKITKRLSGILILSSPSNIILNLLQIPFLSKFPISFELFCVCLCVFIFHPFIVSFSFPCFSCFLLTSLSNPNWGVQAAESSSCG